MVTTQAVMEQLAGKGIFRELVQYLGQTFEDFGDVQCRYTYALETLRNELGQCTFPSTEDLKNAIERQATSDLFFAGILGLKSNLDHFFDPMAKTVLEVDFEVYLREDTAQRLPEYEKAQKVIDQYFEALSPKQKKVFEEVTEYCSYLKTTGPKLAHFYGYIVGDEMLHWIVPGYHSDDVLTMQYKAMLDSYFGKT